ncbi:alpha/beta fold hydrolase [Streptomyces sp. JHA19]|uniref:alpha/beta fold hydrolase n=1 Tax=Streptomyces sp. JHA19 TaxID=1577588 RepID=UPI0006E3FCA9|nr:hypothetical protein [Streptomyces sp. JHA19]
MKPITPPDPARAALTLDGRRLSYLDFGGPGHPLLALHGHFSEGRTLAPLARALLPHRAPTRTALTEQLGDSARYPLLIHGTRSDTLTEAHAKELVSGGPHTSLAQLPTGHTVHEAAPDGFAATVSAFLDTLKG